MRTAIYVYSATATFTIDQDITVCPDMGNLVSQSGSQVTLAKGIYKTTSTELVPVGASDHDIVVIANDKDPWPDPPARFWKTFPTMTQQQLGNFFPASFGAQSAASDAQIRCDEKDWPKIRDVLSKAGIIATRAA